MLSTFAPTAESRPLSRRNRMPVSKSSHVRRVVIVLIDERLLHPYLLRLHRHIQKKAKGVLPRHRFFLVRIRDAWVNKKIEPRDRRNNP